MLFLVSKARKPKFELQLKVIDLNNVPLVSGTSYVKWHLPTSTAAEHRGRTSRCPIHEHKVTWDYMRTITLRLQMDKNNHLLETLIHFEVVQDYSSSGRPEKISLGQVKLNLAEYVDGGDGEGDGGEGGIVRRYLMQESKINSTLKIGIAMKQLDGERNYVAPPLKTAPVFGGIAGIMAGERVDPEDLGDIHSKPRIAEHGDMQDLYRRALAASWLAQPGELPPDQCIEDIFAGGDGWSLSHSPNDTSNSNDNHHHHHEDYTPKDFSLPNGRDKSRTPRLRHHFRKMSSGRLGGDGKGYDSGSGEEGEGAGAFRKMWTGHERMHSGGSGGLRNTATANAPVSKKEKERGRVRNGNGHNNGHGRNGSLDNHSEAPSGLSTVETSMLGSTADDGAARGRSGWKRADEVDEFDAREDLMAWKLPGTVA